VSELMSRVIVHVEIIRGIDHVHLRQSGQRRDGSYGCSKNSAISLFNLFKSVSFFYAGFYRSAEEFKGLYPVIAAIRFAGKPDSVSLKSVARLL
jgi:hypothetical protein